MRSPAQHAEQLRRRLVTSAALVAGALLMYGLFVGRDETLETSAMDEERGYYLTAALLTEYGPDGAPRIVLHADSIEQQLADQSVRLTDIVLDYTTPKAGKWHVTAARGSLPVTAKSLLLSGDVRVVGRRPQGEAVIRTDLLSYDTESSVVQTAEPVSIEFGAHRLEGRGLYVVLNDGTLRLESDVHGRFVP
jgi:LPS export ABC transporter protein LptC